MLPLVPLPVTVNELPGRYALTAATTIVASGAALPVARRLQADLQPASGFELEIASQGKGIALTIDSAVKGREAYRLTVGEGGIEIRASEPNGLFYGTRTLLQLLPPAVFGKEKASADWSVPCVEIEDAPRFPWRGTLLDVGRHFMPVEFVLKHIDLMAQHKLNVLHMHLTDDQGWRIEIKMYPKLTQVGAWRKDTMLTYDPPTYSGQPHGGFYTQDDVRKIVAYAAERFVTVMPEIELPGHAQAAIAAYPELGNTGQKLDVATIWGVNENVFNPEESTIAFLKDVLDEVLDLFPSKFIHIGGDECPKKQWKESPRAQELMRERGLKDEEELQSWFIRQIDRYLDERGRRLVGWDEILEGGLAEGATVMSWRGEEGGVVAAKAGHDVVMTPGSHTYFDHYQSEDREREPHAIGGFTSLERAYSYEPIPAELSSEEAKSVLGSQGQLWTEYMPDPQRVEYMAWPRLAALAEVVWTPKERKDFPSFSTRMETDLERLTVQDVNYWRPRD
jgi:hexosaminidase